LHGRPCAAPDPKSPGCALPRGKACTRSSSARDSLSSTRGRGYRRSSGRARGSYRLQKSTSGARRRRRVGDEPTAVSRLAGLRSEAGERASEAGSRRPSLEIGGGFRLRASGARSTRRSKVPGASCPGSIVDAVGHGRGSAGSSGFGWKVSCPRVPEVGTAPRITEENAVVGVASLGGLARFGSPPRTERRPQTRLRARRKCAPSPTEVRCEPSSPRRPARSRV